MSHFKIQVSKKYILATEVRRYAEAIQQFLEEMVKEVLLNRPDDVKSFLSSYVGGKMPQGDQTLKGEFQQYKQVRWLFFFGGAHIPL